MHRALCICELVPRLAIHTRLVLVVHKDEERKPTNTGLLAARCLEHSEVVVVGDRERPIDAPLVRAGEQGVLLFPAEDALPLDELMGSRVNGAAPLALVVPDGSWRQARKVRSRVPGLAALPCATLPEGAPTEYRLRSERREGGLATLEAIARALTIIEGNGLAAHALLAVFRVMVERTLWLRGSLRDDEVTGGIPEAARAHDPRGGLPSSTTKPAR